MTGTSYTLIEVTDTHRTENAPDFYNTVSPAIAEFIWKAGSALREFRDNWIEEHKDDNFAKGLELDIVPVLTDGIVMGFMGISEVDGKSYDYAPTKSQIERTTP